MAEGEHEIMHKSEEDIMEEGEQEICTNVVEGVGSLGYPEYHTLPVSTTTTVSDLNEEISIYGAFAWLGLPRYQWQEGLSHKPSATISWSGVAGNINCLRVGEFARGFPRGDPFRNSTSIDIDTPEKCVNIKLGPKSMQVSGAKTVRSVEYAIQSLIDQLIQAEDDFRYCFHNVPACSQAIAWFLRAIQGMTVIREIKPKVPKKTKKNKRLPPPSDNGNIALPSTFIYDILSVPIMMDPSPELGLDFRMVNLLKPLAREFQYVGDIYQHIQRMNACTGIIGTAEFRRLQCTAKQFTMVNHNYHIGLVERLMLVDCLEQYGFVNFYRNDIHPGVVVLLPCETKDTVITNRKKATKTTFTIYRSGRVTQSALDFENSKDAYDRFMAIVTAAYPLISIPSGP